MMKACFLFVSGQKASVFSWNKDNQSPCEMLCKRQAEIRKRVASVCHSHSAGTAVWRCWKERLFIDKNHWQRKGRPINVEPLCKALINNYVLVVVNIYIIWIWATVEQVAFKFQWNIYLYSDFNSRTLGFTEQRFRSLMIKPKDMCERKPQREHTVNKESWEEQQHSLSDYSSSRRYRSVVSRWEEQTRPQMDAHVCLTLLKSNMA